MEKMTLGALQTIEMCIKHMVWFAYVYACDLLVHISGRGSTVVNYKVDTPIMSQPVLWVIHTNKCGSIQLLGQCIVP